MDCTPLLPISGQISCDNWKGTHGIFDGILKFLYVYACCDFLRNSFESFAESWLGNVAVDGALCVLLPLIHDAGNSIECQVNIMMCV